MLVVVIAVVVLVLLVWLSPSESGDSGSNQEQWPLFAKPLLTAREKEFYQCLEKLYPQHMILVQVALSQLVDVTPGTANRQRIRNRFDRLVVDFVLCHRDMTVFAVIELDDASHEAPVQRDRDSRKAKALAAAGLRLVRIPAGPIPTGPELHRMIRPEQLELYRDVPIVREPLVRSGSEDVTIVRSVLRLAIIGIAVVGGWYVFTQVTSTATLRQRELPIPAPVAPTASPKPVRRLAVPFSSAAVPAQDQKQTQAEKALAAQREMDASAKRKEAAWLAYYKAPASCEHPPAWGDQVECGNQYMRAKKAFEQQWEAQLAANGGSQ